MPNPKKPTSESVEKLSNEAMEIINKLSANMEARRQRGTADDLLKSKEN